MLGGREAGPGGGVVGEEVVDICFCEAGGRVGSYVSGVEDSASGFLGWGCSELWRRTAGSCAGALWGYGWLRVFESRRFAATRANALWGRGGFLWGGPLPCVGLLGRLVFRGHVVSGCVVLWGGFGWRWGLRLRYSAFFDSGVFVGGVVCTFYLAGSELSTLWLETHSLTFRRLHVTQARLRPALVVVVFFVGALRDFCFCFFGSATTLALSSLSFVAVSGPSSVSAGAVMPADFRSGVDPLETLFGEGRESSSSGRSVRARLFDRAAAFSSGTSSTLAAVSPGEVPAEPASECLESTPDFVLDGSTSDGRSLESLV